MTDVLDELLEQERYVEAATASMFATLQPEYDAHCTDQDNADSFESLKGPTELGFVDIEDIAAEEIVIKMTWQELKSWYFGNLDSFRRILQLMRKSAKKGNPIERADIEALKEGMIKVDIEAMEQGWNFEEHPVSMQDRLVHELELTDALTVEYRKGQINAEKAKRAAYLINLGIRVRQEVIA